MLFNNTLNTIWFYIIILILAINMSGCDKKDFSSNNGEVIKSDSDSLNSESEKDIGEFVINGVRLRIPRKYISFRENKESGEINAINLTFYLPNLTSKIESMNDTKDIFNKSLNVLIKGCSSDVCNNISEIDFKNTLNVYGGNSSGCLEGEGRKYDDLDLVSYIVKRPVKSSLGKEILIKGDKCKPEYYLVCDIEGNALSERCERWFNYGKKM